MDTLAQSVGEFLGSGATWMLRAFLAILILVVGYVAAKLLSKIAKGLVVTSDLDRRAAQWMGMDTLFEKDGEPKRQLAIVIEKTVLVLLMLLVILFSLEMLGDEMVSGVLQNVLTQMASALPRILKAALILAFAWIAAVIVRVLVISLFRRVPYGEKLDQLVSEDKVKKGGRSLPESIGNFFFYLILVFALLPFFEALGLNALVDPLKAMFTKALNYVPNLLSAALVLVLGYFLARLCEKLVANFAQAAGVNRYVEDLPYDTVLKSLDIARIVGALVFVLLMVPVLGTTFQILDIAVITGVFGTMMNKVAGALPGVVTAFVLAVVGLIAGRFVGDMTAKVLRDVGFDVILSRVGLERLERAGDEESAFSLSKVAGNIVAAVVILIFLMEGFELMHLDLLAGAVNKLVLYVPNVVVAFVLLGLGFYLARVVEQLVRQGFPADRSFEADAVSLMLRYAIIVFAFFMAFDQLHIAPNIVTNAFTILLGTVGLGLALAFGLGGRDHAQEYLERIRKMARERRGKGDEGQAS